MARSEPPDRATGLDDQFDGLRLGLPPVGQASSPASPPIATSGSEGDAGYYPASAAIAMPPPPPPRAYSSARGPIGYVRSNSRPHSTDASHSSHSSGGGRSWVLDSDASSICSMTSDSPGTTSRSGGMHAGAKVPAGRSVVVYEDGSEEIVDRGGEVYRPEGEGADTEFLDHRSEPPETSLLVDRSDPTQVLLRVTLPGFSLDNITVAMRRGKKVHIVADLYGENGGHYERLVFLGSDISSAAPRAEFDGTTLKIYIERRPSRPSSSAGAPRARPSSRSSSLFSSPELDGPHQLPDWRASVASTWSSGSFSPPSPSLAGGPTFFAASMLGGPLSPPLAESLIGTPLESPMEESLVPPPDLETGDLPPPCTARASPPPEGVRRTACVTGPEGARRAARAAREAASHRAREEAKRLDLRDGVSSSSSRSDGLYRKRWTDSSPSESGTGDNSDVGGSNTSSNSSGGEASWPGVSPTASCSTGQSSDPATAASSSGEPTSVDRSRTIRSHPPAATYLRKTSSPRATTSDHREQRLETGRTLDSATTQLEAEIASGSDLKSASSAQDPGGDKVVGSSRPPPRVGDAPSNPVPPTRPKMPPSSSTFRAHGNATLFSKAIAAHHHQHGFPDGSVSPPASSDGENRTPRHELPGLDFDVNGTPRSST
ncbi:hypothetical protein JCM3774_004266 [Rhodotorula dairenensis]